MRVVGREELPACARLLCAATLRVDAMSTTISGNSWEVDASRDDPDHVSSGSSRYGGREQDDRWRCGMATSREQRESAFRLIYEAYVRGGLGTTNDFGLRVTPYHLLSTTTIFTAALIDGPEAGEVFSTVSLIGDGELGLPLERVYPQEVAERRARGLRLAEVSCLADRRQDFRRFLPVFCALNRWMIQFAQAQAVDQVLVAVHPKHSRFYTRYFGFETIGGLANYPTVRNRPAVALCFDFARDHKSTCANYSLFFGEPIPREELQPVAMTEEEIAHFGAMVDPAFCLDMAGVEG
jgi:hypothetical protein